MITFLLENWKTISSILVLIGAAIAWMFRLPLAKWQMKQSKAKVKSSESNTDSVTIDNLEKGVNLYKAIIDDLEKRYSEELQKRDVTIANLQIEVKDLKSKLDKYINK